MRENDHVMEDVTLMEGEKVMSEVVSLMERE